MFRWADFMLTVSIVFLGGDRWIGLMFYLFYRGDFLGGEMT